jgi:hypothetical protein
MDAGSRIFPTLPRASTGVRAAAALALLVLFGLPGCAEQISPPPPPGKSSAPRPPPFPKFPPAAACDPHVDTRGGHHGLLGHVPTLTRTTRSPRKRGFRGRLQVAPLTLPAHTSLMTGLYPLPPPARNSIAALPDGTDTLARTLAAAGYKTGASVARCADACFSLAQGFSIWHERRAAGARRPLRPVAAERMVDRALGGRKLMEGPFLLAPSLRRPLPVCGARQPVLRRPASAAEVRARRRRYGEEIAFMTRSAACSRAAHGPVRAAHDRRRGRPRRGWRRREETHGCPLRPDRHIPS